MPAAARRYPLRCVHCRRWVHRPVDGADAQGSGTGPGCGADRGRHLWCRCQRPQWGCALSWSAKYFTLERLFGAEAVRLVRESERSITDIGVFCAANGIDCDFRLDGTLYTATNAAQVGATDAVIAALEHKGINSFRRLPLEQVQRLAGSARHLEGWFSPAAATVQPGKLVRGLRRVALQRGVRLYEGTAMTGLEHGAPVQVRTAHGTLRADRVVLGLNAWMARVFPQFERSVAIVSSDMVITEPCPELLRQIGLTAGSACSTRVFSCTTTTTPPMAG